MTRESFIVRLFPRQGYEYDNESVHLWLLGNFVRNSLFNMGKGPVQNIKENDHSEINNHIIQIGLNMTSLVENLEKNVKYFENNTRKRQPPNY